MKSCRRIKIFVSSTFRDMDMERDALKNIIVPRLNEAFLHKNLHVDIVDLRHSVETDLTMNLGERENRVFQVCMDEIDSCKPYFLGLIGHRYGWRPDLLGVHSNLFQRLNVPDDFPIPSDKLSVTVCEFIHGLFSDRLTPLHSFIMVRGDKSYGKLDDKSRKDYIDEGEDGVLITTFRNYLADLKCKAKVVPYDLDLTEVGGCAIQKWCDDVYEMLYEEFSGNLSAGSPVVEEEYIVRQQKFISRYTFGFKGRDKVIEECLEILKKRTALYIYQDKSGLGATSLACRLYAQLSDADEFFCLYHNTDTSPYADTYDAIFYYWNRQMAEFLGLDHAHLDLIRNDADALYEEFNNLHQQIIDKGYIIAIFVEGQEKVPGYYSLKKAGNYYIKVLPTGAAETLKILYPYILTGLKHDDCDLMTRNLRGPVREALLKKKSVENVKWLRKAVHILEHLNHSDYTIIRSTESKNNQEENIVEYILGVVESLPDDFNELQLFWIERLKTIYGDFMDLYLLILSVTSGINDYDLSYLTKRNSDWCTYFRYLLGNDIVYENADGYIEINHEIGLRLRQRSDRRYLGNICSNVMEYIEGLPVSSDIFQRNHFVLAMHLRDYDKCLDYIVDENNYTEHIVESPSMMSLYRMALYEGKDFIDFAENIIAAAPTDYESFRMMNLWFYVVTLFDEDLYIDVSYAMINKLEELGMTGQLDERLLLGLCEIYYTTGNSYINSSRSDREKMWRELNRKGLVLSEMHKDLSMDWSSMYTKMFFDAYEGFDNLDHRWEILKESYNDNSLDIEYDDRYQFIYYVYLLREMAMMLPMYSDEGDPSPYINKAYDLITKIKNRALSESSRHVEAAVCDWLEIVLCVGRLSENYGTPSRDVALKMMRSVIEEMYEMSDKYTHIKSQGVLLSELVAAYSISLSSTDPEEAIGMVDRMVDLCLDIKEGASDFNASYYSRYATLMLEQRNICYSDISFAWTLAARLYITQCGTVDVPSRYPVVEEDFNTLMKLISCIKTTKWDRQLDNEFVLLTAIAAKLLQLRESGFVESDLTENLIRLYDRLYMSSLPYYRKRNFKQRGEVDVIKRQFELHLQGKQLSMSQADLEGMIDNEEYAQIIDRYSVVKEGTPVEFYYLGLAYLRNGMASEAFYWYKFMLRIRNLPEGVAFSCKVNCLISALAAGLTDEFWALYESLSEDDKRDTDVVELYSSYQKYVKYGVLDLVMPYGFKL